MYEGPYSDAEFDYMDGENQKPGQLKLETQVNRRSVSNIYSSSFFSSKTSTCKKLIWCEYTSLSLELKFYKYLHLFTLPRESYSEL